MKTMERNRVERNRRRLTEARWEIEDFEIRNLQQHHLQGVLLTMLAHMERACCGRGAEGELERWWGHLRRYRKTLFSPEMQGKKRYHVLAKLLG